MAIVDGYVAATRLIASVKDGGNDVTSNIPQALNAFDSKSRRKENNAVVLKARKYGQWSCSKSRVTIWALRTATKFAPASAIIGEATSGDKSNKFFLAAMKQDLEK